MNKAFNVNENTLNDGTSTAREIESRIASLRSEIAGLTRTVSDFGASKAGELKGAAKEARAELASSAQDAIAAASKELSALERDLIVHVRKNPTQSIAIALGLGFLAALIMRR
jgi:ElaB/YqjD/DUF883 family membrane-anchored ribosome-binding protein